MMQSGLAAPRGPFSGGVMDLREAAPASPAVAPALEGSNPDAIVKQAKGERKERKAKAPSPRKEEKLKA